MNSHNTTSTPTTSTPAARTPTTSTPATTTRTASPATTEPVTSEPTARGAMVFTGVDRDRYWATLRDLDVAGLRLHTALFEAQIVVGPTARHTALVGLHNQLRDMAGLLNHALGGWPEPTGGEPQ